MAGPHHGLCSQSLPSCPGLLLGSLQLLAQGCPADMGVSLVGPRVGDSVCPLRTAAPVCQAKQLLTRASPGLAAQSCTAPLSTSLLLVAVERVHKADWMRLQALGPLHCPTPTLGWEKPGQAPRLGGCTLTPFPSFCSLVSGFRKSLGCACMESGSQPHCTPTAPLLGSHLARPSMRSW